MGFEKRLRLARAVMFLAIVLVVWAQFLPAHVVDARPEIDPLVYEGDSNWCQFTWLGVPMWHVGSYRTGLPHITFNRDVWPVLAEFFGTSGHWIPFLKDYNVSGELLSAIGFVLSLLAAPFLARVLARSSLFKWMLRVLLLGLCGGAVCSIHFTLQSPPCLEAHILIGGWALLAAVFIHTLGLFLIPKHPRGDFS